MPIHSGGKEERVMAAAGNGGQVTRQKVPNIHDEGCDVKHFVFILHMEFILRVVVLVIYRREL